LDYKTPQLARQLAEMGHDPTQPEHTSDPRSKYEVDPALTQVFFDPMPDPPRYKN